MTTLNNDFQIPWIHSTGYWKAESVDQMPQLHFDSFELLDHLKIILKNETLPVYDLGCGNCFYVKKLSKTHNITGIEKDIPKSCHNCNIISHNLTEPIKQLPPGIVLSFEVGEHIPQEYESAFVNNISTLCSRLLIISWAGVNQPGFGHVNCKSSEDVIKLFENQGFKFNLELTSQIRQGHKGITSYFADSLLVFNKDD